MSSVQKNKNAVKLTLPQASAIRLIVDGQSSALQEGALLDESRSQALQDSLASAESAAIRNLECLIQWEPRARLALFGIIAYAIPKIKFSARGTADEHEELLDAIVNITVGCEDPFSSIRD